MRTDDLRNLADALARDTGWSDDDIDLPRSAANEIDQLRTNLSQYDMLTEAAEKQLAANDAEIDRLRETARLYEELRKTTDGGSESMTHEDAVAEIHNVFAECEHLKQSRPINCCNILSRGSACDCTLCRVEAERDRLAAIVEQLPKTADGVPVVPGMALWIRDIH